MQETVLERVSSPEAQQLAQWAGAALVSLFVAWRSLCRLAAGVRWAFAPGRPSPLGADFLAALDRPEARLELGQVVAVPSLGLFVRPDDRSIALGGVKVNGEHLTRADRRLVLRKARRLAAALLRQERQAEAARMSTRLRG